MKYLSILLLLAIGCGPAKIKVDPEIAPYFARFTQAVGIETTGISAVIVDLKGPLGACDIWNSDGSRLIQIDSNFWTSADDDAKEQVIFHELGHCAMYLGHIPDLDINNCPVSIMYPYAFGDLNCYRNYKNHYYLELIADGLSNPVQNSSAIEPGEF